MYRLLILILLLSSCSPTPIEDEPPQVNYGDYMFPMSCIWDDGSPDGINITGTVVYCFSQNVSSEIIDADFFSLSIQYPAAADERVKVCGENLNLYSGYALYDNILPIITNEQIGCVDVFDRIENDEFDWSWHEEERVLGFKWRPENNPPLDMYLVIEEPKYGQSAYSNGYLSESIVYLLKGN